MKLATFGDSFTATVTYEGVQDKSWLDQIQEGPFAHELFRNYAEGGSVSGQPEHYVYEIDGEVLPAMGLLGQIRDYINEGVDADTHVIWSGTNDLVVASMQDPFVTAAGAKVKTTPIVDNFRKSYIDQDGHSKIEYSEYIVTQYLAGNIHLAINLLREADASNIVVVGYFNLGQTPLALRTPEHSARGTIASDQATEAVSALCFNYQVPFIDLSNIPVTTIDEIHPDHEAQRQTLKRILLGSIGE